MTKYIEFEISKDSELSTYVLDSIDRLKNIGGKSEIRCDMERQEDKTKYYSKLASKMLNEKGFDCIDENFNSESEESAIVVNVGKSDSKFLYYKSSAYQNSDDGGPMATLLVYSCDCDDGGLNIYNSKVKNVYRRTLVDGCTNYNTQDAYNLEEDYLETVLSNVPSNKNNLKCIIVDGDTYINHQKFKNGECNFVSFSILYKSMSKYLGLSESDKIKYKDLFV